MKKKTLRKPLLTATILAMGGTGIMIPMTTPEPVYAGSTSSQYQMYQQYRNKIEAVKQANHMEFTLKLESELKSLKESPEKVQLLKEFQQLKSRQVMELSMSVKKSTSASTVGQLSADTLKSRVQDMRDLARTLPASAREVVYIQDEAKKLEEELSLRQIEGKLKAIEDSRVPVSAYESSLRADISKVNLRIQGPVTQLVDRKMDSQNLRNHDSFKQLYLHLRDADTLNEMKKIESRVKDSKLKGYLVNERESVQKRYPVINTSSDYARPNEKSGDYQRISRAIASLDSMNANTKSDSDILVYKAFLEGKINRVKQTRVQSPTQLKYDLARVTDKQLIQQIDRELSVYKTSNDERDLQVVKNHISVLTDNSMKNMSTQRMASVIQEKKAMEVSLLIRVLPDRNSKYLSQIKTKLDGLDNTSMKSAITSHYLKEYDIYTERNAIASIKIVERTLDINDYNIAVSYVSKVQNPDAKKSMTAQLERIKKGMYMNKTAKK